MDSLMVVAKNAKAKKEAEEAARKVEEEKKKAAVLPNLTCDSLIYPLNWAYGIWVICTLFGYAYLHSAPPALKLLFEDSGALRSLKFAYVLQASWFIISFRERLQMSAIVLVFISRQLYTSLEIISSMNLPEVDAAAQLQSVGQMHLHIDLDGAPAPEREYAHPALLVSVVMVHYAWAVVTTLQAFNMYLVRTRVEWRLGLFISLLSVWIALGYSVYCVWTHEQYIFSLVTSWVLGAVYFKVRADRLSPSEARRIYDYGKGLEKVYRMALEGLNVRVPREICRMTDVITTNPRTVEEALHEELLRSVERLCLGGTIVLIMINIHRRVQLHGSEWGLQLPELASALPEWTHFSASWACFAVACLLVSQAALTYSYSVYNSGYQIYIAQVMATKEKEA